MRAKMVSRSSALAGSSPPVIMLSMVWHRSLVNWDSRLAKSSVSRNSHTRAQAVNSAPASSTHPWPVMTERRKERVSMEMAAPASTSRNIALTGIRLISAHPLSTDSRCRRWS